MNVVSTNLQAFMPYFYSLHALHEEFYSLVLVLDLSGSR